MVFKDDINPPFTPTLPFKGSFVACSQLRLQIRDKTPSILSRSLKYSHAFALLPPCPFRWSLPAVAFSHRRYFMMWEGEWIHHSFVRSLSHVSPLEQVPTACTTQPYRASTLMLLFSACGSTLERQWKHAGERKRPFSRCLCWGQPLIFHLLQTKTGP